MNGGRLAGSGQGYGVVLWCQKMPPGPLPFDVTRKELRMNRVQYLLIKLMEEASEVTKQAAKASQFGLDSRVPGRGGETNEDLLCFELDDLIGVVDMLRKEGFVRYNPDTERMERKQDKVNRYYEMSKLDGHVQETPHQEF